MVVGAALLREGLVLLGHRRPDKRYYPDCWDVLGGHVEPGESAIQALVRELKEETGVEATVTGLPLLHIEERPETEDGLVFDVWAVTAWRGEPMNSAPEEHDDLRWFAAADLPHLRLAHRSYPSFLLGLLMAR